MLAAALPFACEITCDWLTSRTFTFRTQPENITASESFVFHSNGCITGYSHPNETFWSLEGADVHILDQDAKITCVLSARPSMNGKIELYGDFRDPELNYATSDGVHIFEENASDFHSRVQSFDLFDTLVARRCYEPLAVFRSVETKSGVGQFAARRHAVEMAIFGRRTYGLDDIYALLVADGFVTEQQADVLKLMELEEEWGMLFPIREIIARVNPRDIIISDMYLPRYFVERILKEKCGLGNTLYLSNYGKHHKEIWPSIKESHSPRSHYGDNIHADVIGPSEFGIQPILVNTSKWNHAEQILNSIGLSEYAYVLRETRLETFNRNPRIAHALSAQLSINIPLMLLGALWIKQCAGNFGVDKILTCARDCNLWHEILSSLHFARIGMPLTSYIKISRTLCHSGTDAYEAYFRSNLGERTLLVDMVGTGKSLVALVDNLDLKDRVFPCILVADPVAYRHNLSIETLIFREFMDCRIFIEGLNASVEGTAVAAISDESGIRILTQPNEFSAAVHDIIDESRLLLQRFLSRLNAIMPPKNIPSLVSIHGATEEIFKQLPSFAMRLEGLLLEQGANLARGKVVESAAA